LLTFAVVAGAISLITDLPRAVVLLLAALASMWGPILADFWRNREVQVVGLIGAACALVVLSVVLSTLPASGGVDWVAGLGLALLSGIVGGECIWRLRLLDRKGSALLSLSGLSLIAALAARHFDFPALPLGLAMGLVLGARQGTDRQLEHLLAPARPIAILLFVALLAASADVGQLLWPVPRGLFEVLAVQIAALVLIRGIGPALWYPLPSAGEFSRQSSWLLLPRGLIAGELILGAGAGLPEILSTGDGALLRAVVFADLFIFVLLFGTLAAIVPLPAPTPPVVTQKEADAA
jgi:hypothetical protein